MTNIIEANTVDFAPAIVEVSGKTKTERQLSVARHATIAAQAALVNAKGKLGKEIRSAMAVNALGGLAVAASNANYRPVAEYLAALLGEPIVVTSRASFESLPDQIEARIMKVKMSKSGGYTTDKKTGTQKLNSTMMMLCQLKDEMGKVVMLTSELVAKRQAERAAKIAE